MTWGGAYKPTTYNTTSGSPECSDALKKPQDSPHQEDQNKTNEHYNDYLVGQIGRITNNFLALCSFPF